LASTTPPTSSADSKRGNDRRAGRSKPSSTRNTWLFTAGWNPGPRPERACSRKRPSRSWTLRHDRDPRAGVGLDAPFCVHEQRRRPVSCGDVDATGDGQWSRLGAGSQLTNRSSCSSSRLCTSRCSSPGGHLRRAAAIDLLHWTNRRQIRPPTPQPTSATRAAASGRAWRAGCRRGRRCRTRHNRSQGARQAWHQASACVDPALMSVIECWTTAGRAGQIARSPVSSSEPVVTRWGVPTRRKLSLMSERGREPAEGMPTAEGPPADVNAAS
jgi:hypothetical protein